MKCWATASQLPKPLLKPTWCPRIPSEVSSTGSPRPRVQPIRSRQWSRAGSASHSRFNDSSHLSQHVSLAQDCSRGGKDSPQRTNHNATFRSPEVRPGALAWQKKTLEVVSVRGFWGARVTGDRLEREREREDTEGEGTNGG